MPASTLSSNVVSEISITETFTGPFVSLSDPTAGINGLNEDDTYTAATTVPITKKAAYELTLSGGAGSINLASLPGNTPEETIDGTTLKLQAIKLKNRSDNANKMTFAKGASNGYGTSTSGDTWTVTLSPGQSMLLSLKDAAPDVAAGVRVIDVTGTASQVGQIVLLLG